MGEGDLGPNHVGEEYGDTYPSGQHSINHSLACEDLQTPHLLSDDLFTSRKYAERIRGIAGSSADPQSFLDIAGCSVCSGTLMQGERSHL